MRSSRKRALRAWVALLATAALVAACADRIWPSEVGLRAGRWLEKSHRGNWSRAALQRQSEWSYNHPDRKQGEPGLCVALSGGGLRSASFAIGVLAGLHEAGVLRQVDRVSAVSGGAFALSWYLVHHYDAWKGSPDEVEYDASGFEQELFDSSCPGKEEGCVYQRQLEAGMDIVTNPFEGEFGASTGQAVTAFLLSVPAAFANLLVNGLFGWHANLAPMQAFYQARIERVFHHRPRRFSSLGFYELGRRGEAVRFPDLQGMLLESRASERSHLPFPIIVTAVNLNHTGGSAALHVANRLFELTPEGIGSDAFGPRRETPFDLHRAVAVSGAALDSDISLSGPPSLFAAVLNMDLGYHVDNPLFRGDPLGYRLTPFPAYFFLGWQNDLDGVRIHLTDGGHAENLGAFPLFRRLCRQTLIVDGTYDPNLGFEDYLILRESLRGELGLQLDVRPINLWVKRQRAVARIVRAVKLLDDAAPDLDYSNRLAADLSFLQPVWAERIGDSCCQEQIQKSPLEEVLRDLRKAIKNHLDGLEKERRWEGVRDFDDLTPDMAWLLLDPEAPCAREWRPVMTGEPLAGTLRGFQRPEAGGKEVDAPLDVLYLKLNLPRSVRLDPGGRCEREVRDVDVCKYRQKERTFPQQETGDLSFEGDQFRAYRSLGTAMATKLCRGDEVSESWFNPGSSWSYTPLRACPSAEPPPEAAPAPDCEEDLSRVASPGASALAGDAIRSRSITRALPMRGFSPSRREGGRVWQ